MIFSTRLRSSSPVKDPALSNLERLELSKAVIKQGRYASSNLARSIVFQNPFPPLSEETHIGAVMGE